MKNKIYVVRYELPHRDTWTYTGLIRAVNELEVKRILKKEEPKAVLKEIYACDYGQSILTNQGNKKFIVKPKSCDRLLV